MTESLKRKLSSDTEENIQPKKNFKGQTPTERTDKTCLVKNLPRSYNSGKIKKLFNNCGVIASLETCDALDRKSRYARLEFTNSSGALAALTKTYKKVGSNEIEVVMLNNCTLWITNFPPNYSSRDLRQMLIKINVTPVQIRLPSRRFNANRRFCYVDLTSEDECDSAVNDLNGKEISGYKLVVKHSDPSERTKRTDAAVIERREVFVRNLQPETLSADHMKEVFNKFGEIERITIPKHSRDSHNACAFIIFQDQIDAEKACTLNGTELDDRVVSVQLSDNKAYLERKEVKELLNSRNFNKINSSITLFPISDKISREQVLDFIVSTCQFSMEDIFKIHLVNDLNGAIVTFHDPQKAARATIVLDRSKFQNRIINVGTISDLKNQRKERESLKETSGENKRHCEEISANETAPKTTEPITNNLIKESPTDSKPVMSNDDFRKMFLGK
ncbi:U6 snRNP complex subunit [Maudiozyma humilis]|uniref:U6 snRNP complex subunit n=1 Tax=Maudiozyma humilis TaxID=51915 RepID=A0AAV5S0A3_MAUHU|nr:U6 snRNP complex subunit [Kazachstania humilis]